MKKAYRITLALIFVFALCLSFGSSAKAIVWSGTDGGQDGSIYLNSNTHTGNHASSGYQYNSGWGVVSNGLVKHKSSWILESGGEKASGDPTNRYEDSCFLYGHTLYKQSTSGKFSGDLGGYYVSADQNSSANVATWSNGFDMASSMNGTAHQNMSGIFGGLNGKGNVTASNYLLNEGGYFNNEHTPNGYSGTWGDYMQKLTQNANASGNGHLTGGAFDAKACATFDANTTIHRGVSGNLVYANATDTINMSAMARSRDCAASLCGPSSSSSGGTIVQQLNNGHQQLIQGKNAYVFSGHETEVYQKTSY